MYQISALFLCVIFFLSCKQNLAPAKTYRGILILGDEVSDFRDCSDPDLKYWVVDETEKLGETYSRLAAQEYESVYMEMEAIREVAPALGYAGERDGQMRVKKIIRMEKRNAANDCMPVTAELTSDSTSVAAPSSVYPVFADPDLAAMYERYLDLKGALVASDAAMAGKGAQVLYAASTKYSAVQQISRHLSGTTDLEEQRSLFTELNQALIPMLRKSPPLEGQVFVFRTNEPASRYWLANEARINNPYDGSKKNAELTENLGAGIPGEE